jgi:hypothetical protein
MLFVEVTAEYFVSSGAVLVWSLTPQQHAFPAHIPTLMSIYAETILIYVRIPSLGLMVACNSILLCLICLFRHSRFRNDARVVVQSKKGLRLPVLANVSLPVHYCTVSTFALSVSYTSIIFCFRTFIVLN